MGNLTINLGYQILILHILGFWPIRGGVTKVLARCVLVAVSQLCRFQTSVKKNIIQKKSSTKNENLCV